MAVSMVVRAISLVCIFTALLSTDPQEYLERYGYLTVDPAAASSAEELLNNGILQFQDFHNLPLTGVLDEETLLRMDAPRCGMPDIEQSASGRLKRYAIASRWRKKDLQFTISKYSENGALSPESVDKVFLSAAKLWEQASDLSIKRIKREKNADMIVSFLTGSHQTNRSSHTDKNIYHRLSFDGPGGVLAHASFPPVGEIHFDDDENWLLNGAQKDSYDLMWGAVHEIGHALGLKHTKAQNSVMNPVYKRGVFGQLGQDDIDGIVELYGEPSKDQTISEPSTKVRADYTGSTDFAFMSSTEESCEVPESTDAVLTIGKAFFMFRGDEVWMFNSQTSSPHFPVKISSAFPGISGPVTAAMAGINNKVYFFRNKVVWRWDWITKSVDKGYPKSVRDFGLIYDDIIAAFKWSHNDKAYLFGSRGRYWRYDLYSNTMDPGYPRSIRTWRGIPYNLDDITSAPDGKTYVFKDKSYWIYSDKLYRLHGQRYEIENMWLSCGAGNANLEALETGEDEVAALTDSAPTYTIRTTLLLILAFLLAG